MGRICTACTNMNERRCSPRKRPNEAPHPLSHNFQSQTATIPRFKMNKQVKFTTSPPMVITYDASLTEEERSLYFVTVSVG